MLCINLKPPLDLPIIEDSVRLIQVKLYTTWLKLRELGYIVRLEPLSSDGVKEGDAGGGGGGVDLLGRQLDELGAGLLPDEWNLSQSLSTAPEGPVSVRSGSLAPPPPPPIPQRASNRSEARGSAATPAPPVPPKLRRPGRSVVARSDRHEETPPEAHLGSDVKDGEVKRQNANSLSLQLRQVTESGDADLYISLLEGCLDAASDCHVLEMHSEIGFHGLFCFTCSQLIPISTESLSDGEMQGSVPPENDR
ncbi:unnamed protein product [Protopolystoma xenopodis]|uniref:Uncharacterized protein n=1 Tax=Protopolystoma xenopodis TaxID=117903 RepID=A0A3S5BLZ2_9PLAT|nr:unnamed protein product [Protopolystoma xenopodis]